MSVTIKSVKKFAALHCESIFLYDAIFRERTIFIYVPMKFYNSPSLSQLFATF